MAASFHPSDDPVGGAGVVHESVNRGVPIGRVNIHERGVEDPPVPGIRCEGSESPVPVNDVSVVDVAWDACEENPSEFV
jgi:hypothetical protein